MNSTLKLQEIIIWPKSNCYWYWHIVIEIIFIGDILSIHFDFEWMEDIWILSINLLCWTISRYKSMLKYLTNKILYLKTYISFHFDFSIKIWKNSFISIVFKILSVLKLCCITQDAYIHTHFFPSNILGIVTKSVSRNLFLRLSSSKLTI